MDSYLIPTEYCLLVSALRQANTLRATSALLKVDPATLVRKFQKISSEYDLLMKNNQKWVVTEKGHRVAQWFEESVASQKVILEQKPKIRVASYSWLAEQKMIPHFAKLDSLTNFKFGWEFKTLYSDYEKELLNGQTDFVVTGHAPNDPLIAFKKLASLDWKVIVPYAWKKEVTGLNERELIEYLQKKPYIRFSKINPANNFKFDVGELSSLQIDGTIGIRSAVANGLGWASIPAMSASDMLEDKRLFELNLQTLITDHVSLWWLRSRKDAASLAKTLTKWVSYF